MLEADSSAGPLSWLYGARGGDELVFTGCGTRPLGSYLKALGVLRLIGEQLDPDATARWVAQNLVLETAGDEKRVVNFFLSEYRPTPMIAPWNGRGGFNIDENRTSEQLVAQIEDSTDERLSSLRSTIGVARDIYGRAVEEGWDKERWVQACRASFPDEAVRWLDATTVLTDQGVSFPFLLGTGGNLGSMDLSNNFMERLGDALGVSLGTSTCSSPHCPQVIAPPLHDQ